MVEEKRSSWSPSQVALAVTLSVVTGLIGYGLKYIFEPGPRKTLAISESRTKNLISIDEEASQGIIATYRLRGQSGGPISSFYQYTVNIENTGNEGVDGLKIVTIANEDFTILRPANIEFRPEDLRGAVNVIFVESDGSPSRSEVTVSLLNPGEEISFGYGLYSTTAVSEPEIKSVVRKKNWKVAKRDSGNYTESDPLFDKKISEFTGKDVIFLTIFPIFLFLGGAMYLYIIFRTRFLDYSIFEIKSIIANILNKGAGRKN